MKGRTAIVWREPVGPTATLFPNITFHEIEWQSLFQTFYTQKLLPNPIVSFSVIWCTIYLHLDVTCMLYSIVLCCVDSWYDWVRYQLISTRSRDLPKPAVNDLGPASILAELARQPTQLMLARHSTITLTQQSNC